MLGFLKYAGVILAAGFAILGIFTEFKDKTKNEVTLWGKIAVVGIILSGIISIESQHLENIQEKKRSQEADARTAASAAGQSRLTQAVNAVARNTEPIQEIEVEFWIQFPRPKSTDDPNLIKVMAPYLHRLDNAVAQIVKQYPLPVGSPNSYSFIALPKADKPIKVVIPPGSSLLPSSVETVPFVLMSNVSFYLDIYDQPIDPKKFWSVLDWHEEPTFTTSGKVFLAKSADLELGSEFQFSDRKSHCELNYEVESHDVTVHCQKKLDKDAWNTNGTISYMQDLLGKQIFLRWQLGTFDTSEEKTIDLKKLELRPFALLLTADAQLDTAVISINKHPYQFLGSDFRQESNYISVTFPTTEVELEKLKAPGWNEFSR